MSPALLLLAAAGWALILTQGHGPWGILARARAALRARASVDTATGRRDPTLLTCAMCCATWTGAALAGLAHLAAAHPPLALPLDIITHAGAAAGLAWIATRLASRSPSPTPDP